MNILVDIFIVKIGTEIVINKSLCGEVEFLRFCFFFILKKRKNIIILNLG